MATRKRRRPSAPSVPSRTGTRSFWGGWRAVILAASIALTYSNSLSGPFILDDQASIVENPAIREWWRLGGLLIPVANSPVAGRPLVNLSFALNYAAGGFEVLGYHVLNVALHLACAFLVFGIVRRTLELPRLRERAGTGASNLALAVALVWSVHPLNSEVVNYLSQRTESMMAACLLLTLYATSRSLTSSAAGWKALAVISCWMGMGCKETMAVAPVLVVLYDRAFWFGSWREAFRSRLTLYAALAASWLVLAALVLSGPRAAIGGFSSGVSAWTYLLNQSVIITDYLRLTIWPASLVVFYGWPLVLTLGEVVGYAALIVSLLTLTVVVWLRTPEWGYLGAWFFIALAPASSVIAIATEVGAERRMYLPLAALAVLLVMGVNGIVTRFGVVAAGRALLVVVCIALAATTMSRNREYASGLTLARTVVERRPTAIAYHILGEQLLIAGRSDEAITSLREAVGRGNSRARYVLGGALFNEGRRAEAFEQFDAFSKTAGIHQTPRWLEPSITELVIARALMAEILATDQRWSEAAAQARLVLETVPTHLAARRILAFALFNQQQWPDAVERYRDYLGTSPRDAEALVNFGVSLVAVGRIDEAIDAFRRAVAADPMSSSAKRLLEMALHDRSLQSAQP